jgi:hypothetical protein
LKRKLGKWRTAQKITLIPGYHEFPINLPTFFRRLRPNLSDTMNACWEQTGGFDALMKYAVFHCTTQSGYEGIINAGLVKKNKPVDKVIDGAWTTTGSGVFDFGHDGHKFGDHKIAISKYYLVLHALFH